MKFNIFLIFFISILSLALSEEDLLTSATGTETTGTTTVIPDETTTIAAPGEGDGDTTVAPEDTTASAADTTVAPADTTASPADTTVSPGDTTVAPVDTTASPADTTVAPVDTTAAPADTTVAPAVTTASPADTTVAPAVTTASPADTTETPADTTKSPEESTESSGETTTEPAKETTTTTTTTTQKPPSLADNIGSSTQNLLGIDCMVNTVSNIQDVTSNFEFEIDLCGSNVKNGVSSIFNEIKNLKKFSEKIANINDKICENKNFLPDKDADRSPSRKCVKNIKNFMLKFNKSLKKAIKIVNRYQSETTSFCAKMSLLKFKLFLNNFDEAINECALIATA